MTADLAAALSDLDAALAAADPRLAATLRPGAPAPALACLEKVVGALTPELRAWFAWHDGQRAPRSIGPDENDTLITAEEAAEAWQFLRESGGKPWKATWLPVATNGAGDYVVCDRSAGALLRYHHDDRRRPELAPSLTSWASRIAAGWRRVVASAAPVAAPDGWKPVKPPKRAALGKRPDGTAFHFRAPEPRIGKGVFYKLVWKQKGRDSWFTATSTTLDSAWTSIANNLFPFQAQSDGWVASLLAEADGEVLEARFAAPPLTKK